MEENEKMRTIKEIKDLISVLEEATKKRQSTYSLQAEVCIDCEKVISIDNKPVNTFMTHLNHLTIESDVDRTEIDDWVKALKWVLNKNKAEC